MCTYGECILGDVARKKGVMVAPPKGWMPSCNVAVNLKNNYLIHITNRFT